MSRTHRGVGAPLAVAAAPWSMTSPDRSRAASTASQPEDHLGALCESMRLMIESRTPLRIQRRFYERRLLPWYTDCLHDLAGAHGARFHADGARLAMAFFDTETQAFLLVEPEPSTSNRAG
jgi:TorA maturation chaperone TorD